MIDIDRCKVDRKRLVLIVGDKNWHISYKEAKHLLKKLKQFKVDKKEN